MSSIACSVDGCERKFKGRGYCATHLSRLKIHGDPLKGAQVPRNTDPCLASGCDDKGNRSKGYCAKHYWRMKANGSHLDEDLQRPTEASDKCSYCRGPIPAGGRLRMYCSTSCATSVSRGHTLPEPTPCGQCGEIVDFSIRTPSGRRRDRQSKLCDDCKPRANLKRHVATILARDGGLCGLCGGAIRFDLVFPHTLSASVDHIIPRSHGGPDDLENLRLAHLGCNCRRGNRLD